MEFLNPTILWGLVALGIPVLIHLWNGRKGIRIAWAAVRFLEENENKPVRHIKFERWLLLLLRLVLLTLLVLILAILFWDRLQGGEEKKVIHLVEPAQELLSEFRFELQQAINKGEEVFWLDQEQKRIEDLESFTFVSKNEPIYFGNILALKEEMPEQIHLYLTGNEESFGTNFYPVTITPTIHISEFAPFKRNRNLIQLNNNKYLFINDLNQLEIGDTPVEIPGKIYDATFNYHLDLKSEKHSDITEASLKSLQDVFGLEFRISEKENAQLYFTDKSLVDPKRDRIYWKTGEFVKEQYDNIYHLRAFDRGDISMEAYAEIPELIMTDLLDFLEIKGKGIQLNKSQIQRKFHLLDIDQKPTKANTFEILWVLFLFVLVAERVIANTARL